MPPQILNRYTAALGAVIAAGLVLHLGSLPRGDAAFVRDWFNIGHVLGFAVLACLLVRALETGLGPAGPARSPKRGAAPVRVYAGAAAIALALAVGAEAAQLAGPRDASLGDLGHDLAGTGAGLAAARALATHGARRAAGLAAAALVALAGAADPGATLLARGVAHARFPVLVDFETRLDGRLAAPISARIEREPAPRGWPLPGRVARVEPRGARRYEGIAFRGFPRDWSSHEQLSFTIAAAQPVSVTVRIEDVEHDQRYVDRFNRSFEVGPGAREIRIPLADVRSAPRDRALDLENVARIGVFMTNPDAATLHLDRLRLE